LSDITKDPENKPPPQNQTDAIMSTNTSYPLPPPVATIIILFSKRCHHHRPPPLLPPLPPLSATAIAIIILLHGCFFCCHCPPLPSSTALPPSSSLSAAAATSLSSNAAAIIVLLRRSCHVFVLHHSHHVFVLHCRHHHRPLLGAPPPSSFSSAANNTSVTPVKMKPSEDITINNNNDMGIKTRKKKATAAEMKETVTKRTTGPSPKKHIAGKDAAADVPRTSNKDDFAKDSAETEADEDKSMAGASTKNNVAGKAASADISKTTPSKEDFINDPSTVTPNTANMPPSINVSGVNIAIANLPAIAFPSAFFSITLTKQQNSRNGLPHDKIVSI
jgi:hypothetical protein